jgi:multidrug resistance efflux pump
LAAAGYVGYHYWLNQQLYVSTDNAQVAGPLVQVAALNAGRVENVPVNVGDRVQQDQVVGTLLLPSTISTSQSGTPRLGFVGSENQRVGVKSPISGLVAARSANPGATVAAGQPLVILVDPTQLWVDANIEETQSWRVHVGQPVEVHLDALDATVPGRVEAVTPATASSFSLLPQSNTSGNFTKVTQVVTARIAVDFGDRTPPLGSSASVRIRVADSVSLRVGDSVSLWMD